MALTDAQRRAQEAYRKRSVKQVAVRFYPADDELWAWLSAKENKAGYMFWRSVDLTGNQTRGVEPRSPEPESGVLPLNQREL